MKVTIMKKYLLVSLLILSTIPNCKAEINKAKVEGFFSTMAALYQPEMSENDLENYFAYIADDLTDYHAAYGVTMSGVVKPREAYTQRKPNNISYKLDIESLVLGTNTAVAVIKENAIYIKQGKEKHFIGRTIYVLEFNSEGLIHHMRRYLD